jgi:hypothetical protein
MFVFTAASLLSWISCCLAMREHHQPVSNVSRAFGAKNGEDASSGEFRTFRDGTSMKGYV